MRLYFFLNFIVKCMLCVRIRIASSNLMNAQNIPFSKFEKKSLFASRPTVMINPLWLEQSMSRTNSHGPKGVRATEGRLELSKLYISINALSLLYYYI